jgi:surface carbohydrate biosynthesis protein
VIFHAAGLETLSSIVDTNKCHVFDSTYIEGADPRVFLFFFLYLIKEKNIRTSFCLAVLKVIKPKLVLTWVDNSKLFHSLSQKYKSAKFLAIQNGNRLIDRDVNIYNSNMVIEELAVFGDYEIELFKSRNLIIKKFHSIGSLRDSLYRDLNYLQKKIKFDICFVSQIRPNLAELFPEQVRGLEILANYLYRYVLTKNLTLCICMQTDSKTNSNLYEYEKNWHKVRFGERAIICENHRGDYQGYKILDSAKVSVGLHSTMLRELAGRGGKVLACNYTGDRNYDFQLPGILSTSEISYEVFESKLSNLLKLDSDEYTKYIKVNQKFLINYSREMPTHVYLKNLIAEYIG